MTKLMDARNISIEFGGLKALNNFNMEINSGELVGLIGPNGAGKTTAFNVLTGIYQPSSGEYELFGEVIKNRKPYQLVESGLARTFQNIRLFKHLSVLQNVRVPQNNSMTYSIGAGMFRTKNYWKEENEYNKRALDILKIFEMDHLAEYEATSLPYGEQRKLEIARAMASSPKILLLDEPAAGMNPKETEELMKTIRFIRDEFGIAILLIEHDMKMVLGICERLVVLDMGNIIAEGDPMEVVNDKNVIKAYLGTGDE